MKEKYEILIYVSLALVLITTGIIMAKNKNSDGYIETSASLESSNTKIEWGIKREDNHKQPDLGKKNKELIEKYNGLAMGNSEEKNVYLTFDLGYEAGYTEDILNTLKENNVPAAFFVTAHYVNTHPELVKRMIEDGHDVGNHTVNHKSLPELADGEVKKEVMGLHTSIYEQFGYEMKYIRPPKGEYSERVLQLCQEMNYIPVMWSFAYDDWEESKQGREEYGKKKILDNLHPGEVMLLHGTSKDNASILKDVIQEIKKEGYEFKKLGDM